MGLWDILCKLTSNNYTYFKRNTIAPLASQHHMYNSAYRINTWIPLWGGVGLYPGTHTYTYTLTHTWHMQEWNKRIASKKLYMHRVQRVWPWVCIHSFAFYRPMNNAYLLKEVYILLNRVQVKTVTWFAENSSIVMSLVCLVAQFSTTCM